MEKITAKAKEVLNQGQTTNMMPKNQNNVSRILKNNSEINALDLIGKPITAIDVLKAEELLKMNYGVDYPVEKFQMLWEMIKEDKWSDERLRRTVKWFLKNKKFPNWTIADWYDYEVKIYPYSWYQEQIGKGVRDEDIEKYKINGKIFFKLKDNNELPFEKIEGNNG